MQRKKKNKESGKRKSWAVSRENLEYLRSVQKHHGFLAVSTALSFVLSQARKINLTL
jgi:hypothetical protein